MLQGNRESRRGMKEISMQNMEIIADGNLNKTKVPKAI